ncbi:uncharacterized protein Dwil_GK27030 [Drosophila willistoni]|uniref:trypsin n=1 Tax=Drosophila willistoni TaxID=7260 RepID=A0A0Q9WPA3_DROWI|nr:uncharacterized protein Dwil_GK27030 [Drosophila willistoni]
MKLFLVFASLAVVLAKGHPNYINSSLNRGQDTPTNIIFNGYKASDGQAPYIVSLRFSYFELCGGSIIGDTWILTAAHCLINRVYVDILYGSNHVWKPKLVERVGNEKFISHQLYSPGGTSLNYDIALIQTPRVAFSDKINKISLPKFSNKLNSFAGQKTTACGWGLISHIILPKYLRCIDVEILSNQECAKTYDAITDDILCTGVVGGKSTCNGDSGGPLVTRTKPPILVGIVAFGDILCSSDSFYTRVTTHLEWIYDQTDFFSS